jgi:Tol biopolymer transport system component
LTYVRAGGAPAMTGDSRGYGAWLGTVPDYSAMQGDSGGVLLSDVRAGGPAALAGIKGGDRITRMAGSRVENLYDMTFALQDHRPGDTIEVVVIRDGAEVAMKATLGDRALMAMAAAPAGSPGAPVQAGGAPPVTQPPAHAAAPAPASPSPASPHGPAGSGAGPEGTGEESGVDPFYEGRPGADFVIGAGVPFATVFDGEKHLADVRQLTSGGENAEAYFSPDGRSLILQVTAPGAGCDQQYVLDLAAGEMKRVSTGTGRTTCGYYDWPEADRIVYASTHEASAECPAPPDRSAGYVWPIDAGYELYEARPDGSGTRRLTESPGYDAEATWCHRGGRLVFTSVRDGDLDLYAMEEDGHVERLTDTPGYDGGAFYSPDCREIVWRAGRPTGEELADYRSLLGKGLVRPTALEIFLMDANGGNVRQLTKNGAANFCPVFTADGKAILYASNTGASPREFDIWRIDKNGGEPERITHAPGFDGFPQFSPDGRYLVWGSNRANPQGRETNIFIARWVE